MNFQVLAFQLCLAGLAFAQDWRPAGKVLPADGRKGDFAGASVAANDGFFFVGTPGDDPEQSNNGTVRVYAFDGVDWSPVQTIAPTELLSSQIFGNSMALHGGTLVVGAPSRDVFANQSGAAFVFHLGDEGWQQSAMLVPQIGGLNDFFGISVAIEGDVIAVGPIGFDDPAPNPGFVCIFELVEGVWTLSATIEEDPAVESSFGLAVAVENGDVFATSGGGEAGQGGGVAVIRKVQGEWTRISRLTPGNNDRYNYFGDHLAAADGRLFVSAYGEPEASFAGAVYVFEETGGAWLLSARLTAPDAKAQQLFGESLAAFGDTLVVGSRRQRCGWESTIHVFEHHDNQWSPTEMLIPWDPAPNGTYGPSVAVAADFLIAGEDSDSVQGSDSGSAFAYSRTAPLPCPGDLNHDGRLDLFDLMKFMNLRRLGECDADLNGDERIDLFDLLTLQNYFAAGCPG